eukprot:403364277
MDSCSFFPWEDQRFVQAYQSIPLYYNPLMNMILEKCEYNEQTVHRIDGTTWIIWYPLESMIEDLEAANEVLVNHGFTLVNKSIKSNHNEIHLDNIDEEYAKIINESLPALRKRLDPTQAPRIPKYALILEDDSHDWQYIYEALWMSQLMVTGEEKWKFYTGFKGQVPTDSELHKLKVLVLPGGVQKILKNHPQIKMIGGCFGAQLIAQYNGGAVEKMFLAGDRPKILGREQITFLDVFFEQPYVQSFMKKRGLTKETFPNIVLQESHGDNITKLPEGAIMIGSSESCEIEMYQIEDRVLAFQSHPDFNCGFQQEISEVEYFKFGVISLNYHKIAFLRCQDSSKGIETRNFMFGIIREFIKPS